MSWAGWLKRRLCSNAVCHHNRLMYSVVYPYLADNCCRPLPSHLGSMNQPVIRPRNGFGGPLATQLTCSKDHLSCPASRLPYSPTLYTPRSCGRGGTRERSTSCSVHT